MPTLVQTTALTKISSLKKKLRIVQGGTSASKTFSIVAYLIHTAQSNENLLISIVSETLPHLKKGAIRDFMTIMKGNKYFDEGRWHKSDSVYTFESGSIIEFFSADQPGRVHGPRRDILFLNECNNVHYPVYVQLSIRTRKLVVLDYNPIAEFWVHTEVIPHRPHDFLTLTYLDNEALSREEVLEIESYKHDTAWWKVYGLGQLGQKRGQVYDNWTQVSSVPEQAKLVRRGLDFGYTNDPTCIVDIYQYNDEFVVHERKYATGMKNNQIAEFLLDLPEPEMLVIADSAEPKSIDEIKTHGVQIIGASKGPGSISQGIDAVRSQKIAVTKDSINIIKEQRNYLWKVDRDDNPINTPIDSFNHAMDAIRYALTDIASAPEPFKAEEDLFFA